MQTLGLSESTLRSESRLKSLFWPSIHTANDVDYLGAQGYWVCAAVAVFSFVFSVAMGHAIAGAASLLFYFLGGVGVRERSRYAAAVVLALFVLGILTSGPGVVSILMAALLLSNLRATWIAARWKPDSDEAALPPRFGETWSDKFADKLPMWLWPKVRVLYYVFSACLLLLVGIGLVVMILHRGA